MGSPAFSVIIIDIVASVVFFTRGTSCLFEEAVIAAEREGELEAHFVVGGEPDYGSGPYLWLMARAVRLARSDLANPVFSADARMFLGSDIVSLFAECLGYEGDFGA